MGIGKYIIQEERFLLGFIWWGSDIASNIFETENLAKQKLENLQEKERINFESKMVLYVVLLGIILIYLNLKVCQIL